jgi:hypothetical protein
VFGDSGNDTIDLADGERDEVDCGEGEKYKIIFDGLDAAAREPPPTPATARSSKHKEAEVASNRLTRPRGPGSYGPALFTCP